MCLQMLIKFNKIMVDLSIKAGEKNTFPSKRIHFFEFTHFVEKCK